MPSRSALLTLLLLPGIVIAAESASLFRPLILNGAPTTAFPEACAIPVRRPGGGIGLCSGTLIAPKVLLTAAHCLGGHLVEVGALCQPGDGSRIELHASEWVPHPEYQGRPHADIGLVFLSSPIGSILPATLPTARPTGRRGDIVGYGVDGADTRNTKRVGSLKLMKRCPRKGRRKVGLLPGELAESICWKPKRRGNDTCVGDSGGPLFVDGQVVGVTSAAITASPLGCPGKLSWSTDVASFRSWIDAEMAAR